MKTIFLGIHDAEIIGYTGKKVKITFYCPYCKATNSQIKNAENSLYYGSSQDFEQEFYHTCDECGQDFKVHYGNY